MSAEYYKERGLGEWYSLEFSQYSQDENMFPFHIGPLTDAIEHNLVDFYHNNRGANKWQIVFIGTFDECQEVMTGFEKNKRAEPKPECKE